MLVINYNKTRLVLFISPSYIDKIEKSRVFDRPKRNATLNGSPKSKSTRGEFVEDARNYLERYNQRSNSESGFVTDKRMLGWNIAQRRDDRIDNTLLCASVQHNLPNMGWS
jgi:transposase